MTNAFLPFCLIFGTPKLPNYRYFWETFGSQNGTVKVFICNHISKDVNDKYIIVDDLIIITTFNYTPTQFTYIDNVNIESFISNPAINYHGVHSEVGHMLIVNDNHTVNSYLNNFKELLSLRNTLRVK